MLPAGLHQKLLKCSKELLLNSTAAVNLHEILFSNSFFEIETLLCIILVLSVCKKIVTHHVDDKEARKN
jgi:predicted membrane protein